MGGKELIDFALGLEGEGLVLVSPVQGHCEVSSKVCEGFSGVKVAHRVPLDENLVIKLCSDLLHCLSLGAVSCLEPLSGRGPR